MVSRPTANTFEEKVAVIRKYIDESHHFDDLMKNIFFSRLGLTEEQVFGVVYTIEREFLDPQKIARTITKRNTAMALKEILKSNSDLSEEQIESVKSVFDYTKDTQFPDRTIFGRVLSGEFEDDLLNSGQLPQEMAKYKNLNKATTQKQKTQTLDR